MFLVPTSFYIIPMLDLEHIDHFIVISADLYPRISVVIINNLRRYFHMST